MADLLSPLLAVAFFLAGSFFTVCLNLVSAYAKPPLDDWLARYSETHRQRQTADRARLDEAVAKLVADPTAALHLRLELLDLRMRAPFIALGTVGTILLIGSAFAFIVPSRGWLVPVMLIPWLIGMRMYAADQRRYLPLRRLWNEYERVTKSPAAVFLAGRASK
jgi:hypothetical protein